MSREFRLDDIEHIRRDTTLGDTNDVGSPPQDPFPSTTMDQNHFPPTAPSPFSSGLPSTEGVTNSIASDTQNNQSQHPEPILEAHQDLQGGSSPKLSIPKPSDPSCADNDPTMSMQEHDSPGPGTGQVENEVDSDVPDCQRFIRDSLVCCFTKLMSDEAVKDWKLEIQKAIYNCSMKCIELCVLKLDHDCTPLLYVLGLMLDPKIRFHNFNASRLSETAAVSHNTSRSTVSEGPSTSGISNDTTTNAGSENSTGDTAGDDDDDDGFCEQSPNSGSVSADTESFAENPGSKVGPKMGWLLDFINQFGELGGFAKLLERFTRSSKQEDPYGGSDSLTVFLISGLLKPFGCCAAFLTKSTIVTYLKPIVDMSYHYLTNLPDSALKKDIAKLEGRESPISSLIHYMRCIMMCCPGDNDQFIADLNLFRFQFLLRLLKISSFSGKMNALSEINRLCSIVGSHYGGTISSNAISGSAAADDIDDGLTTEQLLAWITDSKLLHILLKENLHHSMYVDRLEKIIRFMIKEGALSNEDLDALWAAHQGKHDAIVKNVHSLLAKLAWDFSPQELDYLFQCFKGSWRGSSSKEREQLLELMRHLAEDDKDGIMASKVLDLLWSLAHSPDLPTETVDLALAAHVKILDYSCSADRDRLKLHFLERCVFELCEAPAPDSEAGLGSLANSKSLLDWVIPALTQIREICKLYNESQSGSSAADPSGFNRQQSSGSDRSGAFMTYRHDVLTHLHQTYSLVVVVTTNLLDYMNAAAAAVAQLPAADISPDELCLDRRYSHPQQISDRLEFLRFLLTDGQLWLCEPQAKQIWDALVQDGIFAIDRDIAFRWFASLMGEEPDLDPDTIRPFFEQQILQLDVVQLTDSGLRCFDTFFKQVNQKENRLLISRRNTIQLNHFDLIGTEYLWRIILHGNEEVANQAIQLFCDAFSCPSPRLSTKLVELHQDVLNNCMEHLKANYVTLSCFEKDDQSRNSRVRQETTKMSRILSTLHRYIMQYDESFIHDRIHSPLYRAFCGRCINILVRFPSAGGQCEDVELVSHSNVTVSSLRRHVLSRFPSSVSENRLDLLHNGVLLIGNEQAGISTYAVDVLTDGSYRKRIYLTGKLAQGATVGPAGNISDGKQYWGGGSKPATSQHAVSSSPNNSSSESPSPPGSPSNNNNNNNSNNTDDNNNNNNNNAASAGGLPSYTSVTGGTAPTTQPSTTGITPEQSVAVTAESVLPSCILARNPAGLEFLFSLADTGAKFNSQTVLQEARAITHRLPLCQPMAETLARLTLSIAAATAPDKGGPAKPKAVVGRHLSSDNYASTPLDEVYFSATPSQVLYNLALTYIALMPSSAHLVCDHRQPPLDDPKATSNCSGLAAALVEHQQAYTFRHSFLTTGRALPTVLGMLVRSDFLPDADASTKCEALAWVLRLVKFVGLSSVYAKIVVSHQLPVTSSSSVAAAAATVSSAQCEKVSTEEQVQQDSPSPTWSASWSPTWLRASSDVVLKSITCKHGVELKEVLLKTLPEDSHVNTVMKLIWAAAAGMQHLYSATTQAIHDAHTNLWANKVTPSAETSNGLVGQNKNASDVRNGGGNLCESDLDMVLTGLDVIVILFDLSPMLLQSWFSHKAWESFVLDLIFSDNENVRNYACDSLFHIAILPTPVELQSTQYDPDSDTKSAPNLIRLLKLLFQVVDTAMPTERPCHQFFSLIARLLKHAFSENIELPNRVELLNKEIKWMKTAKEHTVTHFESYPHENLMVGHLCVTGEIANSLDCEQKFDIGCKPDGANLIRELIDDFVLPASRMYVEMRRHHHGHSRTSTNTSGSGFPRSVTDFPLKQADSAAVSEKPGLSGVPDPVAEEGIAEDSPDAVTPSLTRSKTTSSMVSGRCIPVCGTPQAASAVYDLLVGLSTQSAQNLRLVVELLTEMFYEDDSQAINEWEYMPPIGLRPTNGFVGLKNGGATCYMNSVLQQLFMLEPVREILLGLNAGLSPGADDSDLDEDSTLSTAVVSIANKENDSSICSDKKEYHMAIVRNLQLIFGHLLASQLQFYIPRKFWRLFRFAGESINLREQHDAVEFLDHVIDSIDEVCKLVKRPPLSQGTLGGILADQKICKDCPHRYSKDASFTYLSVDIRNVNTLEAAMSDYVRGELLEGADAYFCENCQAKVDAVKRLCIKRLPQILAIQLKRFDYDWEREAAVKFNDHFEFPRELDMEPYTVCGLAKKPGELVACDPDSVNTDGTGYRLVGVVVHSGQASGGHYYSYILRRSTDGTSTGSGAKWFKFDDGDVSEAALDDDEELRSQCFGGEHTVEMYDHIVKRKTVRRQKRWWNAYILIYEQIAVAPMGAVANKMSQMSISIKLRGMPPAVERAVRLQNMRALHQKQQFSPEYFNFVKRLGSANLELLSDSKSMPTNTSEELDEFALLSTQLVSKFLFMTGLHAKKTLRGSTLEWVELLTGWFNASSKARLWFVRTQLMEHEERFARYMLECPHQEVRIIFCRLVATLAQLTDTDTVQQIVNQPSLEVMTVSDYILESILDLIHKEVPEHGRHLQQYFAMFQFYASFGDAARAKLVELEVPLKFMRLACDDGQGPPIRYQYPDFMKLYATVAILIRTCDMSPFCETKDGSPCRPNPFQEPVPSLTRAPPLSPNVATVLFKHRHLYIKKIIEDAPRLEENINLIKFLCWENQRFSYILLNEIFSVLFHTMLQELRPTLDLLLGVLMIEDSWQPIRILGTLKGVNAPDPPTATSEAGPSTGPGPGGLGSAVSSSTECMGLFDLLFRHRMSSPRRSYFIVKALTRLFTHCEIALELLTKSNDLKRRWSQSVHWLQEEMEGGRRQYPQYNYNWSPPVQSNESNNSYYLERSNSARLTLQKASDIVQEFCTEDTEADEAGSESGESGVSDDDELVGSNPEASPEPGIKPIRTGSKTTSRKQRVEGKDNEIFEPTTDAIIKLQAAVNAQKNDNQSQTAGEQNQDEEHRGDCRHPQPPTSLALGSGVTRTTMSSTNISQLDQHQQLLFSTTTAISSDSDSGTLVHHRQTSNSGGGTSSSCASFASDQPAWSTSGGPMTPSTPGGGAGMDQSSTVSSSRSSTTGDDVPPPPMRPLPPAYANIFRNNSSDVDTDNPVQQSTAGAGQPANKNYIAAVAPGGCGLAKSQSLTAAQMASVTSNRQQQQHMQLRDSKQLESLSSPQIADIEFAEIEQRKYVNRSEMPSTISPQSSRNVNKQSTNPGEFSVENQANSPPPVPPDSSTSYDGLPPLPPYSAVVAPNTPAPPPAFSNGPSVEPQDPTAPVGQGRTSFDSPTRQSDVRYSGGGGRTAPEPGSPVDAFLVYNSDNGYSEDVVVYDDVEETSPKLSHSGSSSSPVVWMSDPGEEEMADAEQQPVIQLDDPTTGHSPAHTGQKANNLPIWQPQQPDNVNRQPDTIPPVLQRPPPPLYEPLAPGDGVISPRSTSPPPLDPPANLNKINRLL